MTLGLPVSGSNGPVVPFPQLRVLVQKLRQALPCICRPYTISKYAPPTELVVGDADGFLIYREVRSDQGDRSARDSFAAHRIR